MNTRENRRELIKIFSIWLIVISLLCLLVLKHQSTTKKQIHVNSAAPFGRTSLLLAFLQNN